MPKCKKSIAEAYYRAVDQKDLASLEQLLHPDVTLTTPLATLTGKEAVLESIRNFAQAINGLTLRASFSSDEQAMVAYSAEFPSPIGNFPAAALLSFKDDLISTFEIYYDSKKVEIKRDEIFS